MATIDGGDTVLSSIAPEAAVLYLIFVIALCIVLDK